MKNRKNRKKLWAGAAFALMLIIAISLIYYVEASAPNFEASASSNMGESIKITVKPVISKPSLWTAYWRVGTTQVSTVNVGIQVQVSGTNVINPKITYYVKGQVIEYSGILSSPVKPETSQTMLLAAASPAVGIIIHSYKFVSGSNVPVSLGQTFSNSTGSMSIDTHLQKIGVDYTCDQTVDYYVYCQVQATGAISGQTLTATVSETNFASIYYDYGGLVTTTKNYIAVADTFVNSGAPISNFGTQTSIYVGGYMDDYNNLYDNWGMFRFNITDSGTITAATLYVYCSNLQSGSIFYVYRITGSWTETGVCWNNKPSYYSGAYAQASPTSIGWVSWNVYSLLPSTSAPQSVSFYMMSSNFLSVFNSREASSNKPYLRITLQYIDWSLSFQWANQPLSLIAVPMARILVAFSLIGFAGLIFITQLPRGRKGLWAVIMAFILLFIGCWIATAKAAALPAEIPDKWRAGDTAIYLTSFPFPVYETINNITLEVPQRIQGSLIVSLAVWNVSAVDPLIIAIDGKDVDFLASEGFYTCTYALEPGSHSITIYNSLKVFEQAAFIVEQAPQPILIPISEFLEKLKAERETVIRNCLLAAAAGVPVGFWLKRKTKIRTDWILPIPGLMLGIGFFKLPDLYVLLPFASTLVLTYYLCPDFAKWLALAQVKADSLDLSLKLPVDKDQVILGISPRFFRHGFMLKKRLQVVDTLPDVLGSSLIKLNLEDKTCDCIILDPEKGIETSEEAITIYGKPALRKALQDSGIVEKLASELKTAKIEARVSKDLIEEMAVLGAIDLKKVLQSPLRSMLEGRLKSFTGILVNHAHKNEGGVEGGEKEKLDKESH